MDTHLQLLRSLEKSKTAIARVIDELTSQSRSISRSLSHLSQQLIRLSNIIMPNTKKKSAAAVVEKIIVHDHDVLNGRGVNIAHHPGNLRFRALVKSHADQSYCSDYSTSAKKALAEEIIHHIQNLNPPGRFLKRPSRSKKASDVDNGPWEQLSFRETLKKTCQALRDCTVLIEPSTLATLRPPKTCKPPTNSVSKAV